MIFLLFSKYSFGQKITFHKHLITHEFIAEGVAIADVNKDGRPDILAGAFWFEAPDWKPHEIAEPKKFLPETGYSNSFLDYAMDVDQDGWVDLIRISLPGEEAVWYHNPGSNGGHWPMHWILSTCGNESPAMVDIDNDGRPDLLCANSGSKEMVWMKSPAKPGDTLWKKTVIASGDVPGVDRYTHGLGWIDMNGDGRKDVVITKGWWETPADPSKPNWTFHPADLGADCAQIYELDVNQDGKKDLISSSAHDFGIWWHEKTSTGTGPERWTHHLIYNGFSETHSLALADVDGDGNPDLVTGKRYYAHNGGDPGAHDPSVLYWCRFKPGSTPAWTPHQIDDDSGVGLQVLVKDMNGDGLPDIIVCNKKGLSIFEQSRH